VNAIIDAALASSRAILLSLFLLLITGFVTYLNIAKEAEPNVEFPVIYVSIPLEGISPEDAERLLLRPMEQELRSLEGLKEMKATASDGHGSVDLEFEVGVDVDAALADVRSRVDIAAGKLPENAEEPTVKQVSMADEQPVLTIMLSGNLPQRALVTIARDLEDRLEGLKEVLEVDMEGDRDDFVEILVDPLLLESYRLDLTEIAQLVSSNNQLVAAGNLDNGKGRFAIKVPAVFQKVKDLMELPVKVVDDQVVRFSDIAVIRRAFKDPESYARVNGLPTIALEVKKRPGENIIQTVKQIKSIVEELQPQRPASLIVDYTGDKSKEVNQSLNDLQNSVLSAVLLVVIVIIGILGVRTAILVGVAIPGSFLMGILIIAIMGHSINMVVLFGLIMAVGMLVDGAIVVTEYADREMSEGVHRRKAYSYAAKRMAWPIIASTATTLAAFAPLLWWPGIIGQFMSYLPITLIATLSASLLMALIFIPTLGSIFGKPLLLSSKVRARFAAAEQGDLKKVDGFTGYYLRTLATALKRPVLVLLSAIVFSVLTIIVYSQAGKGVEFFPDVEPDGFSLILRSQGDLSINEKDLLVKQVEQRILDIADVEVFYAKSGGTDNIGEIRVNLHDWKVRRTADEIIKQMQVQLQGLAGIEIEFRQDKAGPPTGKDLVLELSSRYPEKLQPVMDILRKEFDNNPHLINVEDTGQKPGLEWHLKVNRADASRFGANIALLGNSVQFLTSGLKLGSYRPDDVDDELDIRVRFPASERSLDKIEQLRVKTASGLVPITNFARFESESKQDAINKVDSRIVLTIAADMAEGQILSNELPLLKESLKKLNLDTDVQIKLRGENEDQDESQAFLGKAFMVALFVMALILIVQFNSFYQAFLILSAVIFSTVGVLLSLLIAQQPFGIIMSGVGVISLAGIVVNNNIVLIDTYNVLRGKGMDALEAVMRTGAQRLRPVMLTTVTTILGLLPMVLQLNIDLFGRTLEFGAPSMQWWSQLATAVAGGLAFATVLTLILTPCMLLLGEKFKSVKTINMDCTVKHVFVNI